MSKHGIWIGDTHELLYDAVTDEMIFREIFDKKEPLVIRVPMERVIATYERARRGDKKVSKEIWSAPKKRRRRE
jgi:hypothetical protein